jgi:transcriptional regulator with XRE-family HTH domain
MTDGREFGDLLRRYRVWAGLTQEELAERAALSRRGLSDLERGARRAPYRDTVLRLADALGLSDDDRQVLLVASRRGPGGIAVRGWAPRRHACR